MVNMKLSMKKIEKFLLGISIALVVMFLVRVSIDLFVHKDAFYNSIPKRAFECLLPSSAIYFIAKYDKNK